ncbi:hypothetical protein H6G81_17540 [Scytonema hofmannii FACHB-248]|uniref:Uncharacterized protein n=1 Tax=Scytonema hofmannii FACHB-248 TaxID=1842502 RepID=A0ABR8GU75_9CYAN|nr:MULTISPECIES: hypothetical protein [Nostocales]MBD2606283.1 hypothetical protein [Scytonema hofmannii FACHB-248]
MIISRIIRKTDKNWAIFTALFLILTALLIARLIPPQGNELFVSAFFVLFSWDMVNAMVGGAIDQAVESAEKRITEKWKANTQEEYLKKQNLEFQAWVTSNNVRRSYSLLQNDSDLEITKKNALIREDIVNVFTKKEHQLTLKAISLKACMDVLNKKNLTDEQKKQDSELTIFRKDIYIYLQAWLMISIKYDREMESELIKQSHPSEEDPKKQDYLNALKLIKDNLLTEDSKLASSFQEKYKHEAITIIKSYLNKLIERIKKEP